MGTIPPYRAEQVGSLLRPPALLEARAAHAAGRLTRDALRAEEDRAILDSLSEQRRVGIDVCTDGELRRGSWLTGMAEAVDGFVPTRVPIEWQGRAAASRGAPPRWPAPGSG